MIIFEGNLSKNFSQAEYHPGSATVHMCAETVIFIRAIQTFRKWINRPMYVVSWARTRDENMKIGGIPTSNHLLPRACAIDWHLYNYTITTEDFKKYCKKWASICKQYGCIGEGGIYQWGVHLGIQNAEQAKFNGHKFYHWDSRTGKQVNLPFKDLYNI
jgi:hypothetical protein